MFILQNNTALMDISSNWLLSDDQTIFVKESMHSTRAHVCGKLS